MHKTGGLAGVKTDRMGFRGGGRAAGGVLKLSRNGFLHTRIHLNHGELNRVVYA